MLLDRRNLAPHLPWIVLVLAVAAAAGVWYLAVASASQRWPGGSSFVGLMLGAAAGLLIIFEFLLWPRKMVRAWRIGRAQTWLRAHIWLGLLVVPLAVLHSGFRLGGELSGLLAAVLAAVVASGLVGLAVQQFLPRMMFEQAPAETIYSQLEYFAHSLHDEAAALVRATCGTAWQRATDGNQAESEERAADVITVGAIRSEGSVQGKVLQTRAAAEAVPGSEPLAEFFHSLAGPFLLSGRKAGSPLGVPSKRAELFRRLRTRLPPPAHAAAQALEDLCEQRRQFDVQARLHAWLHGWLWVHLPLSIVLLVLLAAHIVFALKYW